MKKNKSSSGSSRHRRLEHRLSGYSALSVAALATAAVSGGASVAEAQTTLTAASFGGTLPSVQIGGIETTPAFQLTPVANAKFELQVIHYQRTRAETSSTRHTVRGGAYFRNTHINLSAAHVAKVDYTLLRFGQGVQLAGKPFGDANATGIGLAFQTGSVNAAQYVFGAGRVGAFQPTASNDPATGYVGFRVKKSAGHFYYGWLRVKVTEDANGRPNSISIFDNGSGIVGAYALDGIVTPSAIPEPATIATGLALFALGAAGVREHRKRRVAA